MKKFLIAILAAGCFAAFSGNWIADPFRSTGTVWKKHPFMGKEFWLLLNPSWLTLEGLKNEPFIRESGSSHVQTAVQRKNFDTLRTIAIKEIILSASNGKTVKGKALLTGSGEKAVFQTPEHLFDGNHQSITAISAPITDIKRRYTPFVAGLRITSDKKFSSLKIFHGLSSGGKIKTVRSAAPEPKKLLNAKDHIEIVFPSPVSETTLHLESETPVYSITRLRFYPHEKERLKKYPFYVEPPFRFALGSLLGLRKENIDRESFDAIKKQYPDSFMGFRLAEWDSNFLQTMIRPSSDRFKDLHPFIKAPCTREELLKNFHTFWKMHTELLGSNVYGLSGQVNFMHMGCDFGGKMSGIELTQESKEHPHRNTLMYARGAARQFGVPMLVYTAYYALNYVPDSRIKNRKAVSGLDYGMPPSLGLRNFYLSYYMGSNFLDFESQPFGQAVKNSKGVYELTANGKAIKEIFEWTSSPKGKRGECYTPFLMLADRKHGNDMWNRLTDYWGTWYSLFPAEDPHYMTEYFMQALNPRYDVRSFEDPVSSGNLRNSAIGDIFDLYVANPLVNKSVSLEQISKYAAVFLIDDLELTAELINTLKKYVAQGGTLILSTGQAPAFAADKKFLPAGIDPKTIVRDNLKINVLAPRNNSRVMLKTSDNKPLAVCGTYGNGNVILTASPFWRTMTNRQQIPQQLLTFLQQLQKDVLPVKVSGDCEFLFNIMPDNTWKIILINNRGIVKRPWESHETFHKEYTSTVTVTLPRGVKVKELRKNAQPVQKDKNGVSEYTFKLAPAEILIVDCIGMKKLPSMKKTQIPPFEISVSPEPSRRSGKSSDRYRERHIPRSNSLKTPELIARWRAADNGKDSSGNGNHIKLHNAAVKNNAFVFNRAGSHGSVEIKAPYPLDSGTWSVWVKPAAEKEFPLKNDVRRGGVMHTRQMAVEYYNGFWQFVLVDRNTRFVCKGTKASQEWTHLAVTFADGFCRFFINGKEITVPEGPLKYAANPGKNSFYNHIRLAVGSLAAHAAEIFSFRGEIGDISLHGRALNSKEIKEEMLRTAPGKK